MSDRIHCIARCLICGKEWQDKDSARAKAAAHSRTTGHQTRGEVAYAFEYRRKRHE